MNKVLNIICSRPWRGRRTTAVSDRGYNKVLFSLVASFVSFCSISSAQAPLQFSYQGRLTDSNGVPVVGTTTAIFSVIRGGTAMALPTAGVTNYAEEAPIVSDTSGIFSHLVGTGTALGGHTLDAADFEGGSEQRYVEVRVGGETLLPRQPVVTVPYSITAPGVVPVGGVLMWWGDMANIPAGYEPCTGGLVSATSSPIAGQAKPDLRDKFVMGAPNGVADVKSPVVTGGMNSIGQRDSGSTNLTTSQMPSHNHGGVAYQTSSTKLHTPVEDLANAFNAYTAASSTWRAHTFHNNAFMTMKIDSEGSSESHKHTIPAHDNRPAFLQMFYIIRVK